MITLQNHELEAEERNNYTIEQALLWLGGYSYSMLKLIAEYIKRISPYETRKQFFITRYTTTQSVLKVGHTRFSGFNSYNTKLDIIRQILSHENLEYIIDIGTRDTWGDWYLQ